MSQDLIDFIRGVQPVAPNEVAAELKLLGENGADWPRASVDHWKREIEKLVKDGFLVSESGKVSVAKLSQQMELFTW